MDKWAWLLVTLGVMLIFIASFGFNSATTAVAQSPHQFAQPNDTNGFQIILGIGGLVGVLWAIVRIS